MQIKKIFKFLQKLVEEYIPTFAFIILFIAFNVQVFTRYVLNDPAIWPWDLSLIGFLWTIMLGSIHGVRTQDHISFDMVYIKMSEKAKIFFRLIGEVFVIITFSIAIIPSWDYIYFTKIIKTGVLRLPMIYVFFPFMFFILLTTAYLIVDFIRDIRLLFRLPNVNKGAQV